MARLIVYGDAALDIRAQTTEFPTPGGDAQVSALSFLPGGSAANCAAVAARLGTTAEFVGLVGDDERAQFLLNDLRSYGVGLTHVRQRPGSPGVIIAIVGMDGQYTFLSYRGVTADQPYGDLPPTLLQAGDRLHLSGYCFQTTHSAATAHSLMVEAIRCGVSISLDPSYLFARDTANAAWLGQIATIFPNREEATLLTGETAPERAAAAFHQRGIGTVAIKLGGAGCYVSVAQADAAPSVAHLPAYPALQVVDTIGAGDAFCAGFLSAQLRGLTAQAAARLGMATAAHVVGAAGGHGGAPMIHEALATIRHAGEVGWAAEIARAFAVITTDGRRN
jgi:sugar/nucleoside kinase (ribokinase family)